MRTIAFDIVYGVMEQGKHSDELFHTRSAAGRGSFGTPFSAQEKKFLHRLSYGTIERALFLDAAIGCFSKLPVRKMKPAVRTILRMGAYEILFLDAVPASATCNELVTLTRAKNHAALCGFVNGVLRNLSRENPEVLKKAVTDGCRTKEEKLSVLYSAPGELVRMLAGQYGIRTAEKVLASFYDSRPVTIRVQTRNISKEAVRDELERAGVVVRDGAYTDTGLCLERAGRIEELPGFAEGHFTVQDESSMLPVIAAGIRPDDRVLDVCGSPGGKALHAFDRLGSGGFVSVRDISEQKLKRIRENAKRLRADGMEIKVWDAAVPDEEWREQADVVLADVPCSGIGVIGKKPEIKYHAMEYAGELPALQKKIAAGAATALRPGGTFIYSTCTIHSAENEEMVQWMANELPLQPVSLDSCLPEVLQNGMTRRGMLQILPGLHSGDGFFVAKFEKKGSGT